MNRTAISTAEPRAFFSELGRMRMLGGDPALDFANTLHWRDGQMADFIPSYADLVGWCVPAALLREEEASALIARGRSEPETAREIHATVTELRTNWKAWLNAQTKPSDNGSEASDLHDRLARALSDPWLLFAEPQAVDKAAPSLKLPLARIALAITSLITLPSGRVVRRCEGDPCGGFFIDTSRSRPRRWCSMDTCGNRAKVRGFRSRMVAEEIR